MPIAIQEDLLSGSSLLEKFRHAQALGVDGIEFWADGLTEKVPEIVDAMLETGVVASAVNQGAAQGDLLHPAPAERERALANLRQSVMNAVDIGAAGVIFVPHFGEHGLPDLSPWMSAPQLEAEMLHQHLRTLSDYADALGVDLYIKPVSRAETALLNRLEQVARVCKRISHPRVKIAADMVHMAQEEDDIVAAIGENADHIGYIHLADRIRDTLITDMPEFAAVMRTISSTNYAGWLSYLYAPRSLENHLSATLDTLRKAGLS